MIVAVLCLLVFCLALPSLAIYPEQLGEFDWLLQGIGRISKAVLHNKRIVVSTDAGVIACVNVATGALDWRVVLPEGTSVEEFVFVPSTPSSGSSEATAGDNSQQQLYAYTTDPNQNGAATLRALSAASGAILWEHYFGLSVDAGEKYVTDMYVSEARNQVRVLASNNLYVFSTTAGRLLWSWSPEASSSLRLSSLVVPDAALRSGPARVAVGCIVDGQGSKCSKTALVTADFDKQRCSVATFNGMGNVDLTSLRGSLGEGGPVAEDAIIAVSAAGVSILAVTSGKVGVVAWPASDSDSTGGDVAVKSFALHMEGGKVVQAASRCTTRACAIFRVDISTSGMAHSLQPLTRCAGQSALTLLQRVPQATSVAKCAACVMSVSDASDESKTCAANAGASGSCSGVSTVVTVKSVFSAADASVQAKEFSATMQGQAFASLTHGALASFTTPKFETSVRALIVTSAGTTLLLQRRASDNALEELWRREEALARVSGAVLLDQHRVGGSSSDEDDAALLSLRARLRLQLSDAIDAARLAVEALENLAAIPRYVGELVLSIGDKLQNTFPFTLINGSLGPMGPGGLKSRDIKVTLSPAARARAHSKARRFGFDKLGVFLSVLPSSGSLVVVGMDMLAATPLWVTELPLATSYAKLVVASRTEVCLITTVSASNSGSTSLVFRLDATTGAVLHAGGGVIPGRSSVLTAEMTDASFPGRVLSVFQLEQGVGHGRHRFRLLLEGSAGVRTAADYPTEEPKTIGAAANEFTYYLDEVTGAFNSYKVLPSTASSSIHQLQSVASAAFDPSSERVVAQTSPTPGDAVSSTYTALGDDSLLLKYLNPHTLLVASVSPASAAMSYFSPKDDAEASSVQLHVTLLDAVSAKIIYRASLESAAPPVKAALVEHSLVISYWNVKTKRCELTSVALYEGLVDRYGLTPFASKQSAAAAQSVQRAKNLTAFGGSAPIAMQKTFVLPKTVTVLQHTKTARGIANKNLLLGLTSGQVFALDTRQISPRRPVTQPTPSEREEGLMIYHPFLALNPLASVTHNYALAAGPSLIISSPARLESSSLVLSASILDIHFNRVIPSGGFDLLASDFDSATLTLLLIVLAALVIVLQRAAKRKTIKGSWQ